MIRDESGSQLAYLPADTALLLAACRGHTNCVRLLLDAGADTEAKDSVRAAVRCFVLAPCRPVFTFSFAFVILKFNIRAYYDFIFCSCSLIIFQPEMTCIRYLMLVAMFMVRAFIFSFIALFSLFQAAVSFNIFFTRHTDTSSSIVTLLHLRFCWSGMLSYPTVLAYLCVLYSLND